MPGDRAQSSIDETMRDGFLIRQTDRSPTLVRESTIGFKASHSTVPLNRATEALRAAILAPQPLASDRLAELDQVVAEAEDARRALTLTLWDYLENLGSHGVTFHLARSAPMPLS
jgi:hypothetical protein